MPWVTMRACLDAYLQRKTLRGVWITPCHELNLNRRKQAGYQLSSLLLYCRHHDQPPQAPEYAYFPPWRTALGRWTKYPRLKMLLSQQQGKQWISLNNTVAILTGERRNLGVLIYIFLMYKYVEYFTHLLAVAVKYLDAGWLYLEGQCSRLCWQIQHLLLSPLWTCAEQGPPLLSYNWFSLFYV